MTSSRNCPLLWMSRAYSRYLARADRPQHLRLDHLAEADDGIERRAQLMAHVGEEFRLRAVGRFGPGLFAGIFVGKIGQPLRLLLGEDALLLQVAHRHHQFALGKHEALLVLLERGDVGADRDEAAILGAPLVDLEPAAVAQLHLNGLALGTVVALPGTCWRIAGSLAVCATTS